MNHHQLIIVVLAVTLLSGCSMTRQARNVEKSGFLGDYSMLREGEEELQRGSVNSSSKSSMGRVEPNQLQKRKVTSTVNGWY